MRSCVLCLFVILASGCAEGQHSGPLSMPSNWRALNAKARGDEQHDIDACKRDANLYHAPQYGATISGRMNSFIDCMKSKGYEYAPAVLSQNLNPDVLMMQPAQDWYRCDGAELLRSPKIRRILIQ